VTGLRVALAVLALLAGFGATLARAVDARVRPPGDEVAPRVAAPFRLAIRDLAWNGDPHAMPHGRAVLEAGGEAIWELAGVVRAVASADGATVALLTREHRVFVSRLPEPPRPLDAHEYLGPRLSADGTRLVAQRLGEGGHILERTVGTRGIALVDLGSGESRLVLEGSDLHSPSFASDDLVFFGSGGQERIASLYLLDLRSGRVARVTNRGTGVRQAFPSGPLRLAHGRIVSVAGGQRFAVPAPGDFSTPPRFDAQGAGVAIASAQPELGAVRLRRPNVQVKQPKVYQYYDLNRTSGRMQDWGCFQTTYDQHQGTDFNQSYGYDVVAPASGTVIYRYDGCPDTNSPGCGMGYGNHVAIRHSDGTVSLLAHGKEGTVVGFGTYACGAVLMQTANSGNSNGYHIHHETWKTSGAGYAAPRFDPFQGTCDPGDPSKWSIQNPYGDIPGTTCTH
jgi:murein DD-endopeptidase MepM/ murein hydrolase activator NlpD